MRGRENEGAWDQCAALFITAAVHQPQISVHAEVLTAALPLYLSFPQKGVLMMLSFITSEGWRRVLGFAKSHGKGAILLASMFACISFCSPSFATS